jgi:hypothetical protein
MQTAFHAGRRFGNRLGVGTFDRVPISPSLIVTQIKAARAMS